ncbi:licC domain protein [Lachnospiraceae bacterium]|nr:licC domain protein [Lachnospiraceae bacterium]
MKVLIITAAGVSSRFSESVGYPCLKCLYHENGIEESLLYRMLHLDGGFDRYVVVGGFQYEKLKAAIEDEFQDFRGRLLLVENEHYADYGSGYSLYLGLAAIMGMDVTEVVFAEGDLFVDREGFCRVCDAQKDVVTCNTEAILAEKAVAFYFDKDCGIHYIYDTAHSVFEIKEPFRGIFNSGQVWKFADAKRLRETVRAIPKEDWQKTNLVLIQKYFGNLGKGEYEVVAFQDWVNCNTISDYRKCQRKGGKHENT